MAIALDLFCGAGGASKGLKDAGFKEVLGIDIEEQQEYFDQDSFSTYDATLIDKRCILCDFGWVYEDVDFIWASPPCQRYSIGGNEESRKRYPDLIAKTREMLVKTGKPFVIENVVGAPLRKDLMLCGEMFDLKVIRHRIFEIHGFGCKQPEHKKHKGTASNGDYFGVYTGGRCGCFGNNEKRNKLKIGTTKEWQDAMGINWITDRKMLAEAVPPKYAEYIGRQFLQSNPEPTGGRMNEII